MDNGSPKYLENNLSYLGWCIVLLKPAFSGLNESAVFPSFSGKHSILSSVASYKSSTMQKCFSNLKAPRTFKTKNEGKAREEGEKESIKVVMKK